MFLAPRTSKHTITDATITGVNPMDGMTYATIGKGRLYAWGRVADAFQKDIAGTETVTLDFGNDERRSHPGTKYLGLFSGRHYFW